MRAPAPSTGLASALLTRAGSRPPPSKLDAVSLFVNPDSLDPYVLFSTVLRRSRLGMQTAYDASFAAYLRCAQLLEDHRFGSAPRFGPLGLRVFADAPDETSAPTPAELDAMWADALAEDFQADHQAAPVLLTADDALQRFAKGVLGCAPGLFPGFGSCFGSTNTPVPLTSLLRAGTNALRHVSEWDENRELRGPHKNRPGDPYPDPETLKKGSPAWQAMQSIAILRDAFGIGKDGPIREVVSFRVLAAVDRQIPTPAYERFEAAVKEAARDIARHGPRSALSRLESALKWGVT